MAGNDNYTLACCPLTQCEDVCFTTTCSARARGRVRWGSVQKAPDTLFLIWAFAALANKAFAGDEFGQNPRGCGLNSGWATPLVIF